MKFYMLVNGQIKETDNLQEAAEWFENPDNGRIAFDKIRNTEVSTIFTFINQNFLGGPPLLFETMIFSPHQEINQYRTLCSTLQEAHAMHTKAKALVVNYFAQLGQIPDSPIPGSPVS